MLVFVSAKLCKKAKALDKERAREGVCQPAGHAERCALFLGSARYPDAAVPRAQPP